MAQKKRSRQKSVEAVREEEVKPLKLRPYGAIQMCILLLLLLRGLGFVKEVGFKPGVKERFHASD